MKPVTKSIVDLRAEKEGNAYMLQKSTTGVEQSLKPRQQPQPTPKENKTPQLDVSHQSRVLSSEGLMKESKRKTNYEIFFEILSNKLLTEYSKELAVIRFNNDTLIAIISSLDRLDPNVGTCLGQELLAKKEEIINNCLLSLNDCSFLFTCIILILKKLKIGVPCFDSILTILNFK